MGSAQAVGVVEGSVRANQVYLMLVEDEQVEAMRLTNEILSGQPDDVELLGVLYNYQGPEFEKRQPVPGSSRHGIGLILRAPGSRFPARQPEGDARSRVG